MRPLQVQTGLCHPHMADENIEKVSFTRNSHKYPPGVTCRNDFAPPVAGETKGRSSPRSHKPFVHDFSFVFSTHQKTHGGDRVQSGHQSQI